MAKIVGSLDGQVFIEACVWISVLSLILLGYASTFRKEYISYEKMVRAQSGYPASQTSSQVPSQARAPAN